MTACQKKSINSASQTASSTQNSSSESDIKTKTHYEYQDLYRENHEKRPQKTGKVVYKASDGYYGNQTQGYNRFYYEAKTGTQYQMMDWDKNSFVYQGASLMEKTMISVNSSYASRKFVCPEGGTLYLSGNPRLLSGSGNLVIYRGNTKLVSYPLESGSGTYIDFPLNVSSGDEIHLVLEGEAQASFNPKFDYTGSSETLLHQAVDGEYGDVHPFYDEKNKRMIMYYLSTGKEKNSSQETFSTLATASEDMVNFAPLALSKNEKNPPSISTYYALGVYACPDGKYRSCFGSNGYVGCSQSDDLVYWENGETPYIDKETDMLNYSYRCYFNNGALSGRDPFIVYDQESENYYCIVMNYYTSSQASGQKGLAIYKGSKDGIYSTPHYKALNCTGRGDPECPQIFKIGHRWYIFYSIYGTGTSGNVGKLAYRIGDEGKDPISVDWNSKREYFLDGGELHAAQLCEVGDRYYLYGWITSSYRFNTWGGYLNLSREVYQKADGTLATRLDSRFSDLLNHGKTASFDQETVTGDLTEKNGAFHGSGFLTLSEKVGRSMVTGKIHMNSSDSYGLVSFQNSFGIFYAGVMRDKNKTYFVITSSLDNPMDFTYLELNDTKQTDFSLKLLLDGEFIEAYLNDEYGLTAHLTEATGENSLGFVAKGSGVSFSEGNIYKLSSLSDVYD